MKRNFDEFLSRINTETLLENINSLCNIEHGQTFDDYSKAAQYTEKILKKAGISDCRVINFPADGKTVYQDKRMPLAWKAAKGRLTLKKSPVNMVDPVLADYNRHPFHLIKGSIATPSKGLELRIITENQMLAGENAVNALVLNNIETTPGVLLKRALDAGAVGIISDFLVNRDNTPDALQWVTACTDGNNWHVQAEDREFIGFSITPRNGEKLRQACSAGEVIVLAESDGQRYEGEFAAVTGLIPGLRKEEIWIVSHLYEPLADDNSSGVAGSIEMARIIREMIQEKLLPTQQFSLRLVFSMELYGFAAFTEYFKKNISNHVIGAINTDYMPLIGNHEVKISLAPPSVPFFGNCLMEQWGIDYKRNFESDKFSIKNINNCGLYSDDACISEPSIGIPVIWIMPNKSSMWHNSEQTVSKLDHEALNRIVGFTAYWLASALTISEKQLPMLLTQAGINAEKHLHGEEQNILDLYRRKELRDVNEIRERMLYHLDIESKRLEDFKTVANVPEIYIETEKLNRLTQKIIEKLERLKLLNNTPGDKWFDYAASVVPKRSTTGFPQDLAYVTREKRIALPESMLYGPFARIYANIDGEKSLQRLICEAEWETGKFIEPKKIKKYITTISYLSDCGYLNTVFNKSITKDDIVKSLHDSGINPGDLVMVHSSLSAFGRIEGGAETIIDALLEAVGPEGTVLFPTFTVSFVSMGGELNKNPKYHPFDINDPLQIWVGNTPQAFVKRPDIFRSIHPTHSVAGIGPLAEKCLSAHKETDAPTSQQSPFGKLLDFNGKILCFGCGLGPITFLHFLEDRMQLPYLSEAICKIKSENGTRTIRVPNHLPGHRDFYTKSAEKCKFFRRTISDGLKIKEVSLGLGIIQVIGAKELFEVGAKAITADPDILLCDNPECSFCSKHKKNI